MAKKNDGRSDDVDYINALKDTQVVKVKCVEEMKKSFMAYAMAVNVSRAIPDVRTG